MSSRHPIISVTGSSGSGTTSVRNTFEQIFRREDVSAVYIEGDAFHALDRIAMRKAMAAEPTLSHFAPRANLLPELEEVFRTYAESGTGRTRHYVHDAAAAELYGTRPGTFTPWESFASGSDLLFYEGLNLEWIQKLHRDRSTRGYSTEAVTDVILRRMPDYVQTICPQFTWTDINFQRVPTVDTSNPFIARWIPTADESLVVIRFKDPKGIDFSYLISMIQGSFMSRANSIVIPGGKLDLAMQLILTPIIMQLVERKRRMA
jgi:phosphoribulokinase